MASAAQSEPGVGAPLELGSAGFEAWRGLIFSNSRLLHELDEEMRGAYNFTLGEFDVLATLSGAPDHRRRMCDLVDAVVLTASRLSRPVHRLEQSCLVRRERSAED